MEEKEKIAGIPAEKAREIIENRKATNEANRVPFPGPLRQAFAVTQDIKVGPYTVRPFYDGDFDVLQSLDHPLHKMAFGEGNWGEDPTTMRGQQAWSLCYLMTTPIEEVEALLECDDALEALKKNAKKKFSRFQYADLAAIQTVIAKQYGIYFAPVIGFDQAEDEEGTKKKQS